VGETLMSTPNPRAFIAPITAYIPSPVDEYGQILKSDARAEPYR
jgi:hypothetical protein